MSITAMKQWLEALETINQLSIGENAICLPAEIDGLMDYLRQAIAEAEKQEPVATVTSETGDPDITMSWWHEPALPVGTPLYVSPLYTSPPQRQWVGLTDEQCDAIYGALDKWCREVDSYDFGLPAIAGGGMAKGREIIRAAHGIKGEA